MAKKAPPVKLNVIFKFLDGHMHVCERVLYKSLPLPLDGKQFCHLEKKGNQWILLHTEGMIFPEELQASSEIIIVREGSEKDNHIPNFVIDDGRPLPITRYTAITPINTAPFYHLDELPDNTFRLTLSTNFFKTEPVKIGYSTVTRVNEVDHGDLEKIVFERI